MMAEPNAITTSTKIEENEPALFVSPNPAMNFVKVKGEFPQNSAYIITDVYGHMLKTGTLNR